MQGQEAAPALNPATPKRHTTSLTIPATPRPATRSRPAPQQLVSTAPRKRNALRYRQVQTKERAFSPAAIHHAAIRRCFAAPLTRSPPVLAPLAPRAGRKKTRPILDALSPPAPTIAAKRRGYLVALRPDSSAHVAPLPPRLLALLPPTSRANSPIITNPRTAPNAPKNGALDATRYPERTTHNTPRDLRDELIHICKTGKSSEGHPGKYANRANFHPAPSCACGAKAASPPTFQRGSRSRPRQGAARQDGQKRCKSSVTELLHLFDEHDPSTEPRQIACERIPSCAGGDCHSGRTSSSRKRGDHPGPGGRNGKSWT